MNKVVIQDIFSAAFTEIDEKMKEAPGADSGSTAVVCMLEMLNPMTPLGDVKVVFAWVGDSRAAIVG